MSKQHGLRLTVGGAPDVPHAVAGLSGYYRATSPTPVGGDGEMSLEQAQEIDKSKAPLELVELTEAQADKARISAQADMEEARHGLMTADREKIERDLVRAHRDAQKEG